MLMEIITEAKQYSFLDFTFNSTDLEFEIIRISLNFNAMLIKDKNLLNKILCHRVEYLNFARE